MRDSMRPVLRFNFSDENDREVPSGIFSHPDTLRAFRYTVALDFNIHPNVRMSVSQSVIQSSSSNLFLFIKGGQSAISTETEGKISFKVNKYLAMILGAGAGTTGSGDFCTINFLGCPKVLHGDRQIGFIYDIHPIITSGGFRMDITESRHIADYTSLSVHDNVLNRTESVSAMYDWRHRIRFGSGYYHDTYSFESPQDTPAASTFANGGYGFVTPLIYNSDKVTLEGGFRYEAYAFDNSAATVAAGFFAPRSYNRYGGTGHVILNPSSKVSIDLNGFVGPKRFTLFSAVGGPWSIAGNFGAKVLFKLGRFQPYIGYGYSNSPTPAFVTNTKSSLYTVNSFTFGFSYRF
jgi:hypothetical protein